MKTIRNFIKILIIIPILVIAPKIITTKAHACSCSLPPTADKKAQNASKVFKGKVIDIKINESSPFADNNVFLKPEIIWKGEKADMFNITTESNSAICGYDFEIGKEYIVYAYKIDDIESTSYCSGNVAYSQISVEENILDWVYGKNKIILGDQPSKLVGFNFVSFIKFVKDYTNTNQLGF